MVRKIRGLLQSCLGSLLGEYGANYGSSHEQEALLLMLSEQIAAANALLTVSEEAGLRMGLAGNSEH